MTTCRCSRRIVATGVAAPASRRPNSRQLIAGGAQGAHDRVRLVGPRDADPQRDISDSDPADVATPLDHDGGRCRRATDPWVM
jgi:hypothetical protein